MTTGEQSGRRWVTALKRSVPWIFYGTLALFLVVFLLGVDWDQLRTVEVDPWWIVAATVSGLLSRAWMVAVWLSLLRRLGSPRFTNLSVLADVYAKAWLGRYIPGSAAWILGKIYFASQQGVSKAKLAVSSFLEAILQILVMLLVGLVLLLADPRLDALPDSVRPLLVLSAVGCLVALWPRLFSAIVSRGYRLARKRELPTEHLPTWSVILPGLGMFVVSTVLSGLSLFLLARSMTDVAVSDIAFVIAANALASGLSMIVVFAPSGLGVREALLVVLLALIMPAEIALVVSIVLRLWSIGVDFLFFGITRTWVMLGRRGRARSTTPTTTDIDKE